jgi:hypothetical protein
MILRGHIHGRGIGDWLDDRGKRWFEIYVTSGELEDWYLGAEVVRKPVFDVLPVVPTHSSTISM